VTCRGDAVLRPTEWHVRKTAGEAASSHSIITQGLLRSGCGCRHQQQQQQQQPGCCHITALRKVAALVLRALQRVWCCAILTIRYDTIDDVQRKTDRQAASLI